MITDVDGMMLSVYFPKRDLDTPWLHLCPRAASTGQQDTLSPSELAVKGHQGENRLYEFHGEAAHTSRRWSSSGVMSSPLPLRTARTSHLVYGSSQLPPRGASVKPAQNVQVPPARMLRSVWRLRRRGRSLWLLRITNEPI
jgi:hypothetical protein